MNATQKANRRAYTSRRLGEGIFYRVIPPMIENKVAEVYYRRAMTAEFQRMLESMLGAIKRAYTTIPVQNAKLTDAQRLARLRRVMERLRRQYGDKLDKNAEKIINKYLIKATTAAQRSILKNIRTAFQNPDFTVNFDARKYSQLLKIKAFDNAGLIKNATSQTISNVTNIVYDGVTTGQTWRDIAHSLQNQAGIDADRVKRIARDQTAKLNAALDYLTFADAGIQFFRWHTMHDDRVSTGPAGHKQLDGKIYKLDDPNNWPIVEQSKGKILIRGLPAQRVNCRCRMEHIVLLPGAKPVQNADGSWNLVGNPKSTSELVKDAIAQDPVLKKRSDKYLQQILGIKG